MFKKNTQTKVGNGFQVVTSMMEDIVSGKVLLAGEPVMISMEPITASKYVSQPPRDANGGLMAQFDKKSPKVYIAVAERLTKKSKVRFALAFDGYLQWGLSQRNKNVTILFGGGANAQSTNIEVMVFSERKLIAVTEKNLPGLETDYFEDAYSSTLDELRLLYPGATFYQAAPLPNFNDPDVTYLGDSLFKTLSYKALNFAAERRQSLMLPVGAFLLGAGAYGVSFAHGWQQYDAAIRAYDVAIADPAVQKRGGVDGGFLDLLNARRMFMEQPRRQVDLAQKTTDFVAGIGTVPDIKILQMQLPASVASIGIGAKRDAVVVSPDAAQSLNQIGNDRQPDVSMSVSVPKSQDSSIVQAQAVMRQIANTTGLSLRLERNGYKDDNQRRVFKIEGFIHG